MIDGFLLKEFRRYYNVVPGKYVPVYLNLAEGIGRDRAGIEYLPQNMCKGNIKRLVKKREDLSEFVC